MKNKTTSGLLAALAMGAVALSAAEKTIVLGSDRFEVTHRVTVPALEQAGTLWLPLAGTDAFQSFESKLITAPAPWRQARDAAHGNDVLVMGAGPSQSGKVLEARYVVQRREKSAHAGDATLARRHLSPERLVPRDETFVTLARESTRGAQDDLARARALYRHVLEKMRYDKSGVGWGRGDALFASRVCAGNCTDFHAYFIALCRALDIPARFAIGLTIPADRDEGVVQGYHCWAEFFADGKWVPVDISEAAKHPELAAYYFGHHPANRFEISLGRDIEIQPAPAAGPFNFLFAPLLEVEGKSVPVQAEFHFRRLKAVASK
ncbi:MAG: transglutaminase domain-containing protein [Pedosphaera sp.]|nr:transglutaminase domain-containing protein [Pedosphaera sp.]